MSTQSPSPPLLAAEFDPPPPLPSSPMPSTPVAVAVAAGGTSVGSERMMQSDGADVSMASLASLHAQLAELRDQNRRLQLQNTELQSALAASKRKDSFDSVSSDTPSSTAGGSFPPLPALPINYQSRRSSFAAPPSPSSTSIINGVTSPISANTLAVPSSTSSGQLTPMKLAVTTSTTSNDDRSERSDRGSYSSNGNIAISLETADVTSPMSTMSPSSIVSPMRSVASPSMSTISSPSTTVPPAIPPRRPETSASLHRRLVSTSSPSSTSTPSTAGVASTPTSTTTPSISHSTTTTGSLTSPTSTTSSTPIAALSPGAASNLSAKLSQAAKDVKLPTDLPHVLSFFEDSPFSRKQTEDHQAFVYALGERLKALTASSQAFCKAAADMGQAAEQLSNDLLSDWTAIEADPADAPADDKKADEKTPLLDPRHIFVPVSLASSMGNLGSMLQTMSSISRNLGTTFDALLIKGIVDFRTTHIKACKQSARTLEKLSEDFEQKLDKLMSKKHVKAVPGVPAKPKKKGQLTEVEQLALEKQQLGELRKQYEMTRFNHIQLINEIRTSRRLEMIEIACASFYAFITFFHEGHHVANSTKLEVEAVNAQLYPYKLAFQQQRVAAEKQRLLLEAGMAGAASETYRVSDGFPPPKRDTSFIMRRGVAVQIEKEGYLRKQSTNIKKDWLRRWFHLQGGQLFYFRSSKDLEPQHVVNVILCTVRPCYKSELPFVFEIISPNKRVYTLQADSEQELKEWCAVFQNCAESLLTSQDSDISESERKMSSTELKKTLEAKTNAVTKLKELNRTCVDCGTADPEWVSINLGVFICIDCSGIHRSMGVHISKVRSITLDSWSNELLDLMCAIGNTKFNLIYEGAPSTHMPKPPHNAPREQKDEYIRAKYVEKAFLSKDIISRSPPPDQRLHELMRVAGEGKIEDMLILIAIGTEVSGHDTNDSGRTPLHKAAAADHVLALELLLQNNASLEATDINGLTPLDVAMLAKAEKVITRLTRRF